MNARDAIKIALNSTKDMLNSYLADFSDADLLVRPVPQANHIAWQLGHLISSEGKIGAAIPSASYPELPAGWSDRHGKGTAATEPPKGFATKAEYLALFNQARAVTLQAVEKLSDADMDKPTTGNMARWAPTIGALLMLQSNHTLMHAGQFTVVRRKLGKPILF
jgi:hypothetical protein